jgi:DNA binding domain, excisionase family
MEEVKNKLHLYSLPQAAKMLGIGRDTLKHLINDGKIGVIRYFKRNKIAHQELERFIEENTIREKTDSTFEVSDRDVKEFLKPANSSSTKTDIITDKVFDTLYKEMIKNG